MEYAANGTPHIWPIDPCLRLMYVFRANALQQVPLLASENPRLELTPEEVFVR